VKALSFTSAESSSRIEMLPSATTATEGDLRWGATWRRAAEKGIMLSRDIE